MRAGGGADSVDFPCWQQQLPGRCPATAAAAPACVLGPMELVAHGCTVHGAALFARIIYSLACCGQLRCMAFLERSSSSRTVWANRMNTHAAACGWPQLTPLHHVGNSVAS